MKLLCFLFTLIGAVSAFGMMVVEPVVISMAALREKGFQLEQQGKGPDGVTVTVPRDSGDEQFIRLELVVVSHEVTQESVASDYSGGRATRRAVSETREATLPLFSREAKRAYLAIYYKCPALPRGVPHDRIYLIAVSELPESREK